ncbi:hypothetical protein TPHA_0B01460 [Tetrapisispora phaffii CBS 4417]|uniref:Uncharacterized protein n=1 Tax=Tetrapisispora phaffii (strain ATCC 24235 / CBS 4417 / NBRC 1672 / NRRL Y-8282 / UCD 70-5) TaxID=1071381 RepID=G8BP88_TETPH|nr:hypothetical protein TPHA_0B01460 [Tetrapisispora phaffii CBS 4417]CCE61819.1 hypothetical protein TPHA_0B01460 [Tetrapisispora phaffii CBS 4417]
MDNTNYVVIHNGTASTIAGFSCSESPKCMIPSSYIQKANGDIVFGTFEMLDEAAKNEDNDEVFTIMDSKFGVPYNWEALEKQWRYIYEEHLKVSPDQLPLAITVPSILTKNVELETKIIEEYCKIAFLKLGIPSLRVVNESLAISLSLGKKNSLIIDLSGSGCSVTPILDGILIKNGILKSKFGGDFLDFEVNKIINEKIKESDKEEMDEDKKSTEMWLESQTWIKDFKRSMIQVSDRSLEETERINKEQIELQKKYSLSTVSGAGDVEMDLNPLSVKEHYLYKPKDMTLSFELRECYKLGEYLFQPKTANEQFNNEDGIGELINRSILTATTAATASNNNSVGIQNSNISMITKTPSGSILNSTANSDSANNDYTSSIDIMNSTSISTESVNNLVTNIIIKGSTSLITGIETRIINEISMKFPNHKISVFANQILNDRILQSWLSCSVILKLSDIAIGMGNELYCKEDYEKKLSLANKNYSKST